MKKITQPHKTKTTEQLKTQLLEEFEDNFMNRGNYIYQVEIKYFLSSALSQMEEAVRESIMKRVHEVLRSYCVSENGEVCECSEAFDKLESLKKEKTK